MKKLFRLVTFAIFEEIDGEPSGEERSKMWKEMEEKLKKHFNQDVMIKGISLDVYNEDGELVKTEYKF